MRVAKLDIWLRNDGQLVSSEEDETECLTLALSTMLLPSKHDCIFFIYLINRCWVSCLTGAQVSEQIYQL